MASVLTIADIQSHVAQIAHIYDLKKVTLFGSYAAGKETTKSDIDLLVEFKRPAVSLLVIAGLKYKLEELTGKEVDVIHAPIQGNSFLEIGKEVPLYG